jgi:hypothetical protein
MTVTLEIATQFIGQLLGIRQLDLGAVSDARRFVERSPDLKAFVREVVGELPSVAGTGLNRGHWAEPIEATARLLDFLADVAEVYRAHLGIKKPISSAARILKGDRLRAPTGDISIFAEIRRRMLGLKDYSIAGSELRLKFGSYIETPPALHAVLFLAGKTYGLARTDVQQTDTGQPVPCSIAARAIHGLEAELEVSADRIVPRPDPDPGYVAHRTVADLVEALRVCDEARARETGVVWLYFDRTSHTIEAVRAIRAIRDYSGPIAVRPDTGEPLASPAPEPVRSPPVAEASEGPDGSSLRDRLAGQALAGLLSRQLPVITYAEAAEMAYIAADEMLKARTR